MEARYENLDELSTKKFYLQYRFPPSSVGEVRYVHVALHCVMLHCFALFYLVVLYFICSLLDLTSETCVCACINVCV